MAMVGEEQKVVLMGDVNGRIGNMGNKIGEEGMERVIERESSDTVVNEQGMEVLGMLNSFEMIVLNGVGGGKSGGATCRGKSVVDWIAVREGVWARCGVLEVIEGWVQEGGRKDGDHKIVMVEFWEEEGEGEEEEQIDEREEGNKGDGEGGSGW